MQFFLMVGKDIHVYTFFKNVCVSLFVRACVRVCVCVCVCACMCMCLRLCLYLCVNLMTHKIPRGYSDTECGLT